MEVSLSLLVAVNLSVRLPHAPQYPRCTSSSQLRVMHPQPVVFHHAR